MFDIRASAWSFMGLLFDAIQLTTLNPAAFNSSIILLH
jgi:hypothetical protein